MESSLSKIQDIEQGSDELVKFITYLIEKASSSSEFSQIAAVGEKQVTTLLQPYFEILMRAAKNKLGFRMRYITDIQRENVEHVEKIISSGIDVRHLEGIKGKFAITGSEYITTGRGLKNEDGGKLILINSPDLLLQMSSIFETLWSISVPAQLKIAQIVDGIETGQTEVIQDPEILRQMHYTFLSECKNEILMILPSNAGIARFQWYLGELSKRATQEKLRIHVLAMPPQSKQEEAIVSASSSIELRWMAEPVSVGLTIYDKNKMMITQYVENENNERSETSLVSAIHTTNRQTILGVVSIFSELWAENELKERERTSRIDEERARKKAESSRKTAELLQDILTHDIRNYNQVSRMGVEMLKEEIKEDKELLNIAETVLASIDGSTELVERAKKLGRILSEENPLLYPVNLPEAIDRSLSLVRKAYPQKTIILQEEARKLLSNGEMQKQGKKFKSVLADDLLEDVFVNLFSNSVRYTDGDEVPLEITVEEKNIEEKPGDRGHMESDKKCSQYTSFLNITIIDQGHGIPDEKKQDVFNRYLVGAKNNGLGMSIVHGLVVERYCGKITIRNRVEGDHTKGTIFEVWLPKA